MTQARPLTSSQLHDLQGKSLYVLNTSDRGGVSRSELLMTFNIKGQSRTVSIPNTWIPIDLTTQVPDISQIKENEDFLTHFRRKRLVVIESDTAEEALESSDAQEEYNRVYNIKSTRQSEQVEMLEIGSHNASDNKKPVRIKANMKVLSIINKEGLSETMKLASLKNIKSELKEDDYRYIINQPKTEDNEKIKTWASAQLSNII